MENAPEQQEEEALWLVLKLREAQKIVAAAENGRAHLVVEILRRQAWWPEICAGVRALRHLRPDGYIKLSERPKDLADSCFHTSDIG